MSQDQGRQIFAPFIPTWLRRRVGDPQVRPGMVHSGDATILYADLSGFTRLTAVFATVPDGAEGFHDSLNRCYAALIEAIERFGGDVVSIAGDALTAWWPDLLDPELGRRCGQAMHAAVAALPPVETPAGAFQFALRVGVSAGLTHAMLVGLPRHGLHFVLSGPAVTAAAAAERSSKTGAFVLGKAMPASAATETTPPALAPAEPLAWEHFVHPSLAERLRQSQAIAEYRRCIPAFAAFNLPRLPSELHPLVAQVQAAVAHWGGYLNEIEVGDKGAIFVLLFGAPVARGDDPSSAVGCCLELCERGLVTRAGITFGWLFLGAVGSAQRRVYTAQGDEMNLAAHLMQLAPPGGILISGRVRNDILGRYSTSDPVIAYTKGHSEGVPVARVLSGQHQPESRPATPQSEPAQPEAPPFGLTQARVDQLDEATRLTLKVAAVLGTSFQQRLLTTVHPASPAPVLLQAQLETLIASQLIELELDGATPVYRFKHATAHEVAYRSLLFGQRRQLHSAVARWYEETYDDEIATGAELAIHDQLIRHLAAADETTLLAHYCYGGAHAAARRYALEKALHYLDQGLRATDDADERFAMLLLRVAVNERAGSYGAQANDLAELGQLAAELGDPMHMCYVSLFQLRYWLIAGLSEQVVAGAPALIQGLQRLQRRHTSQARAEAALLGVAYRECYGTALAANGSPDAARQQLRLALARCHDAAPIEAGLLTPDGLAARCLDGLGALALAAGRRGVALGLHQQAVILAGRDGDWSAELRARLGLGRVHLRGGRLDLAFEAARAALATSNAVGDQVGQALALRLLGAVSAARGNYFEAERDAHLAASFSAAAHARALEGLIWDDLAGYAAAQGLEETAVEARQRAESLRRSWWAEPLAQPAVAVG